MKDLRMCDEKLVFLRVAYWQNNKRNMLVRVCRDSDYPIRYTGLMFGPASQRLRNPKLVFN